MRAELKAQKERESSARLNYGSVKAERLPSVGASADYGSIGSELVGAQPTYSYGLRVRVPVFDGGRRDARRAEAFRNTGRNRRARAIWNSRWNWT